ncbi:MAG TPA: histidinol-phosphate transaminase [Microbacteriaceae bacterium]|nr:histidinol-phosphate transaminase [Microbacteriaceae bacterium]
MVNLDDLPIRADLRGKVPYGAPQLHVPIELNVNENTHGVPDHVIDDIVVRVRDSLATVHRYPDREFTALREACAAYLGHGLTADHMWAANGSNEVLQHLLQAFGGPGRTALSFEPSYSMYPLLAAGTGTAWVSVPRGSEFEVSAEAAVTAVREHDPDVVFLCSPNNPTGTPLGLEVIRAVAESARGIVIVDEAYAEFAPEGSPSALELLDAFPRLVVSRTMSKAFAFAGARLGYLAAHPAVCDALRLVRLPYHLSALTQSAALAAFAHAPEMLAMVGEIRLQRDRLVRELARQGYHPYPSASNFVLFGNVSDPGATFRGLLEHGIIIRDVGIPHALRVTAGTEPETSAFLDALAEVGQPLT